jgi:hypothetical protein
LEISQEEGKIISDYSKKLRELKTKIPESSPIASKERLEYGTTKALLKNYIADLKYNAKKISFKEQPLIKIYDTLFNAIPKLSQSIMTSYDNSLWGRQLAPVLTTPRYSSIWAKNFMKSWGDIGKALKGQDAMLMIDADVYSRPNALNGKYDAAGNGYGLGINAEEVFESELPSRVPILGRLYKASQMAYNGGAKRVRADIADLEIRAAESLGKNVKEKNTANALSSMVTSLTGRGSNRILDADRNKVLQSIFWSPKMYAGQINTMTAHMLDPKADAYTRTQSAKNLASRLGLYTVFFLLAKALDPDSVDEKDHLGKIKIWGKWVDVTGGAASWVRLVMKMSDKVSGYLKGETPKYGEKSALDILGDFAEGKFSPTAGIIRDILKGTLYSGEPITVGGMVKERLTPISFQTWQELSKDPTASNIFGLMILESLGVNVSSWLESNEKTQIIPTGEHINNGDFISMVMVYANALGTDPETAFNRIFTGQKIRKISNGAIIVERMPVGESQAVKTKLGGNNPEMRLDHTIPLQLGGSNEESNLKLVTKSEWSSYTSVENALGKALKEGKISKSEAQKLIIDFKEKRIKKEDVLNKIK